MKLNPPKSVVVVKLNVKRGSLNVDLSDQRLGVIAAAHKDTGMIVGDNIQFGEYSTLAPFEINGYPTISMHIDNVKISWSQEQPQIQDEPEIDNVLPFKGKE